jgi:hypothetical protein
VSGYWKKVWHRSSPPVVCGSSAWFLAIIAAEKWRWACAFQHGRMHRNKSEQAGRERQLGWERLATKSRWQFRGRATSRLPFSSPTAGPSSPLSFNIYFTFLFESPNSLRTPNSGIISPQDSLTSMSQILHSSPFHPFLFSLIVQTSFGISFLLQNNIFPNFTSNSSPIFSIKYLPLPLNQLKYFRVHQLCQSLLVWFIFIKTII